MAREFSLPLSVIGPSELGRLKRSLETYNEEQHQASLKKKTGTASEVHEAGRSLRELAEANDCDLRLTTNRESLLKALTVVRDSAPIITVSFAVEPSADFMSRIVRWLRDNIHPQVLVRIGLQPTIAAGCTIRTPGKLYDFSLRSRLQEKRAMLISGIHASYKAAK